MKQAPITAEEIIEIAKVNLTDPILKDFKQRFLIAYTSCLPLSYVLRGGKKKIINGCLVMKNRGRKMIIPLHPTVIKIFESSNYQNTAIPSQLSHKYIRQIAKTANINETIRYIGAGPKGGDLKEHKYKYLYPIGLPISAGMLMAKCGIPDEFMHLLSGHQLTQPKDRNKYSKQLSKLFSNSFYNCLKYLDNNE